MRPDVIAIYTEIVNCPLKCNGITNNAAIGIIPRSFYCEGATDKVDILVVGKNPGTAPDWEMEVYRSKTGKDLVQAHLQIAHDLFYGKKSVGTAFHSNLINRVSGILGVPRDAEAVLARIALTTLVKCQSSGSKQDNLERNTINQCSNRYLMKEIEIFKPVYLLALGKEVYRYLTNPETAKQHKLPVGNLYHPSWNNMKGGEDLYHKTEIPILRKAFLESKNRVCE